MKKTVAEQQQQQQLRRPTASTTAAADTRGVAIGASGQKLPSRIRLKQSKPQGSNQQDTSPGSPPRAAAAAGERPLHPGTKQEHTAVVTAPAAGPTISKDALKAALAERLAEQRKQLQAGLRPAPAAEAATAQAAVPAPAAAAPAAQPPAAPAAPAPTQPPAPARGISVQEARPRPRQQLPAAPRTPTAAAVVDDPMSVDQQQEAPAAAG